MKDSTVPEGEAVSILAHELQGPLAFLRGRLQRALESGDDTSCRIALEECLTEVEALSQLVLDVLFLVRSQPDELSEERTRWNLVELVQDVARRFEGTARDKGVRLDVRVPSSLQVLAEPRSISRAVANLIDNAIKYTPMGGLVEIELVDAQGCAEVRVVDNGIGIPPEHLERIFDRFYRAASSEGRSEGAGLGLALARAWARASGGELRAWSQPGLGSRFTLVLTLAPVD